MPNPLVSVIMPVYGGKRYLREAVESVLRQNLEDFEFILNDDGSTDGSVEIIQSYSDSRLRLLPKGPHLGLFGNLNRLLREACAPLIHIFCQDDVMEADCLSEEVRFFWEHPEIGMSYAKSHTINPNGTITVYTGRKDLPDVMFPELSLQHFYYHGCIPGNLSTVCIRKSSLATGVQFDESLKVSGDYDLWSRICRERPLGIIHQPLVRLRHHPWRLSAQPESGVVFIEENSHIRKRLFAYLPEDRQASAKRYETRRHHVLELHHGFRCLLKGRPKAALRIFRTFGGLGFFTALGYWLLTLNNRLYRPQAKWVLPSNYESLMQSNYYRRAA